MKILTAEQIRKLDKFTIENEPISSLDLMERAADRFLDVLPPITGFKSRCTVICGKGNNGGDGLAIARLLVEDGLRIQVLVIEHMKQGSAEFGRNLYLIEENDGVKISHIRTMADFPEITSDSFIIDAILGIGLSRPLDGLLADVVKHINTLDNFVVSVDIPTGLFAEDNSNNRMEHVIEADHTISFHCPKMSFLMPESGNYVGNLNVIDIGLMAEEMGVTSPYEFVQLEDAKQLHRQRKKFSHKGSYGHALLVAGSKGMMGAVQLAAQGCMRIGAGLLTAHVPSCGLDIMQIGVKEAICSVDSNSDFIIDLPNLSRFNAIGIGPGIGREKDTANVLKRLIQDADARLVIDADGLNILAENRTWLSFIPKGTILTPHIKEFERLAGTWSSFDEQLQLQTEFSKKFGVTVVLKGPHTCITTPLGQMFFNSSGTPGLATAGSGDVLTGIILGLLAQQYSPESAAIFGVYIHGAAAELAVEKGSDNSLVASDITQSIGQAIKNLYFSVGYDMRFY